MRARLSIFVFPFLSGKFEAGQGIPSVIAEILPGCLRTSFLNRDMHGKTRRQKRLSSFFHNQAPENPVNFQNKNISTKNRFFSQGRHQTIHHVSKRMTDLQRFFHKSTPPTTTTSVVAITKSMEVVNGIVTRPCFFLKWMREDAV
jgi:hypothetical protein